MAKPQIAGIAPSFIVRNVPAAPAFYRDRLGFEIVFQGPSDDDVFFGIVRDAFLHVPDPDALAAEFSSRDVEFFLPLSEGGDGLRGFEVKDADGYLLFFGYSGS
jgi:catechol 2,3-dioxygenase-like lactoylglutathione lyase family enzyme